MRLSTFLQILALSLLSFVGLAAELPIEQGKDYKLVKARNLTNSTTTKGEIVEFFSYGCPACYHLEPILEEWLVQKSKTVEFKRVPVVFHSGWDVYAKAYYIVSAMGLEAKLSPKLFAAVQEQNLNLTHKKALAAFLAQEGISEQDFQNAYDNSLALTLKLKQGDELMKQYGIMEIPAFVVNGRFYTNAAMAKGDPQRLLQILDFLLHKPRAA